MQKPRRDTLLGIREIRCGLSHTAAGHNRIQSFGFGCVVLLRVESQPVSNGAGFFRLSQSHPEILHLLLIGAEVSDGDYSLMLLNLDAPQNDVRPMVIAE